MADIPQIQVNGQWVPIDRFLDQTLVMQTPATVRVAAASSADVVGIVPPGQPIGTIYSYVSTSEGLWWMVDLGNGSTGFVLFQPAATVVPPAAVPPSTGSFFPDLGLSGATSDLGGIVKWGAIAILAVVGLQALGIVKNVLPKKL